MLYAHYNAWRDQLGVTIDSNYQKIWDDIVLNAGTGASIRRLCDTLQYYRNLPAGQPSGQEVATTVGDNILVKFVKNSRMLAMGIGQRKHLGCIRNSIRYANEGDLFEEYRVKCEAALMPNGQLYTGLRDVIIPQGWNSTECTKQSFIAAKILCAIQEMSPEDALSQIPEPTVQNPVPAITLLNTFRDSDAKMALAISRKQQSEEYTWHEKKSFADAFRRFRLHFWDQQSDIQTANGIFAVCHDKALEWIGFVRLQNQVDNMFRGLDYRKQELMAMAIAAAPIANAMLENRPITDIYQFENNVKVLGYDYNSGALLRLITPTTTTSTAI